MLVACKKDFLTTAEEQALFAAPTTTELNDIYSEWQTRDLIPTEVITLQKEEVLAGKFKLKIISFKINNIKEYGALLIPDVISTVPVRIWVGGFDLDVTVNSVNLVLDTAADNACILAIPALRGQSLQIILDGAVYTTPLSEGNHCDGFDGATDDVLGFLNLIQATETIADVNRTGIQGGSRGGTVALLAGIRDARVKRVADVAGPTDMFTLTSQNENDPTYQCQFLNDYKYGQATLQETRNKMLASSPLYFAAHLPLIQLHMGLKDTTVPVEQGYNLQQVMAALGNAASLLLFTYDKTHFDIATDNPELLERIEDFFSEL